MSLTQWVMLLITCLIGIFGLFLAAGTGSGTFYGIGLLLFAAAVVYAFALVKQYFDRLDAQRH
jgi:hypothetical protein